MWRFRSLLMVWGLCACDDGGGSESPADAGRAQDAAPDAGASNDSGSREDAGPPVDGDVASDARLADASEPSDADSADASQPSDANPADGSTSLDAAAADGAIDPTAVPMIGDVLTCGARAEVGGIPRGPELARYTIDTGRFPDALCNDGSAAIFFFRPFEGEENRDRWVVQLKGGGSCGNARECALRWCSILTNFGKTQMVADIQRPPLQTAGARGILSRRPDNPWGGYNHVFVQYCSSDTWAGTARDAVVDTFEPCDPTVRGARCPDGSACPGEDAGRMAGLCAGSPVRFRMHFLGRAIVDAVLATLRRDGGPAVGDLPDLDDAEHVVLAGASGGGAGVTNNLDRVAAWLRSENTRCAPGGDCSLVVEGVIDSIFAPSFEGLDFSDTPFCRDLGACDYESFTTLSEAFGAHAFWRAATDESCPDWHQAHEPGSEWVCGDRAHVIGHHLTTPFTLRMGLVDSLVSRNVIDLDLATAEGDPVDTPIDFARLLQPQLRWFERWSDEAHEATPEAVAPAVFGPGCPKHETLSSELDVFDATIDFMGTPLDFFEVWSAWKAGRAPRVLVAQTPADSVCPMSADD